MLVCYVAASNAIELYLTTIFCGVNFWCHRTNGVRATTGCVIIDCSVRSLCCRVHVVFGHVIEGQQVVREIEKQKVDENSCPLCEVRISSCGELVLQVRPKGTAFLH